MTAGFDFGRYRASATLSAGVSSSLLGLLLTGVGISLPTTSG